MYWYTGLWALVPIVAIVGYFTTKVVQSRRPTGDLVARVEALDARVAALEKTLNDIP